jgi:hypothetical protein
MVKPLLAALAVASVVVGMAAAAPQEDTYKLGARLTARAKVPRPTGVRMGATGTFTGKAVELATDKASLTWRLTFSKLSGRAIAAHIHAGKVGKAGPVLLALCGPCRNGQRGSATITHAQLARIDAGATYVNVHTPKNAAGEIRGQVKAADGSGSGSDDSPPPPSDDPSPPLDPETGETIKGGAPPTRRLRRSRERGDLLRVRAHQALEARTHAGAHDADVVHDEPRADDRRLELVVDAQVGKPLGVSAKKEEALEIASVRLEKDGLDALDRPVCLQSAEVLHRR